MNAVTTPPALGVMTLASYFANAKYDVEELKKFMPYYLPSAPVDLTRFMLKPLLEVAI